MVVVQGLTDSQVSSNVVARGLTTTYPLCCVAMELAAQLERRGAELSLEWVPRNMNAEADRLADGDATGFSPVNRVDLPMEKVPWLVLSSLLKAGAAFFAGASAALPETPTTQPPNKGQKLTD